MDYSLKKKKKKVGSKGWEVYKVRRNGKLSAFRIVRERDRPGNTKEISLKDSFYRILREGS